MLMWSKSVNSLLVPAIFFCLLVYSFLILNQGFAVTPELGPCRQTKTCPKQEKISSTTFKYADYTNKYTLLV